MLCADLVIICPLLQLSSLLSSLLLLLIATSCLLVLKIRLIHVSPEIGLIVAVVTGCYLLFSVACSTNYIQRNMVYPTPLSPTPPGLFYAIVIKGDTLEVNPSYEIFRYIRTQIFTVLPSTLSLVFPYSLFTFGTDKQINKYIYIRTLHYVR